jgi:hypothetical protein
VTVLRTRQRLHAKKMTRAAAEVVAAARAISGSLTR